MSPVENRFGNRPERSSSAIAAPVASVKTPVKAAYPGYAAVGSLCWLMAAPYHGRLGDNHRHLCLQGRGDGYAAAMSPGVVVVTGASLGVGRATAVEFAHRGYDVALLARAAESLDAAAAEVDGAGAGRVLAVPVDVAEADEVDAAAEQVERDLGPISVWVNCAMVSVFAPVDQYVAREVRRTTDVTYHGYVYGMMAALRHMLPRDRGVIVNVGSALSYRSIPLQAAYCGAKHAMVGFTASLRCELLHDHSH